MRIIRIGESRVNADAIKSYMPAYMGEHHYDEPAQEEKKVGCDTPGTDAQQKTPSGKTEILFCDGTLEVVDITAEELDALLAGTAGEKRLEQTVSRLIQAMDRMTVHFPTSIRMHM